MLTKEVMEATKQVLALKKVVDACSGTLKNPDADEYEREKASLTLLAVHEILNRLKYVIEAEDMRELEDRFNEIGTFKVPIE